MFLILLIILSSLVTLVYLTFIILFTYGWVKTKTYSSSKEIHPVSISVIIPFRNEEKNISGILSCLKNQNYNKDYLEVILINDHSEDQGFQIAEKFINDNLLHNFKILSLKDNEGFSKKAALTKGIISANSRLIITSDSDCWFGNDWVKTFADFYLTNNCRVISAPVIISNEKKLFSKIQQLEFMSLIASGAGAIGAGIPILANGANFAFEKTLFDELNGYEDNKEIVSGDDVFFLLKAKKHLSSPKDIMFLKHPDSLVFTKGCKTMKHFFNQRIRWASKSKRYKDFTEIAVAASVFFINLFFLVCFIGGFLNAHLFYIALILWAVKFIADFPLLMSFSVFVSKSKVMYYYLLVQLIYPLYIIITTFLTLMIPVKWKGRKIV